jgi:hypothetical protein
MEKKAEKIHADQLLKDLPIQAENLAFQAEEMIFCQKCERRNPPTKLNCFYCGAELEFSQAQSAFIKPNLRKLENWEKGFNLIHSPDSRSFDKAKLPEIAKMLKRDEEFLEKLIAAEKPLPLARVESKREAEIVQTLLTKFGFQTLIIADEDLAVEKPAQRLRGIKFFDDTIIFMLFNQDETVEIAKKDLVLIVSGTIFERRVESMEKRVKKAENKMLRTNETASDEFLLDLYTRRDLNGYRILSKGFDFSCLETEKGILAVENLKRLAQKLQEVAPEVKFVDDYLKMREVLGSVWEVEERTNSQGLKREGFGKFHLENLTTISNLSQFTKYSRLQRQLL